IGITLSRDPGGRPQREARLANRQGFRPGTLDAGAEGRLRPHLSGVRAAVRDRLHHPARTAQPAAERGGRGKFGLGSPAGGGYGDAQRMSWKKRVCRGVAWAALVLVLPFGLLAACQSRLIYFPRPYPAGHTEA